MIYILFLVGCALLILTFVFLIGYTLAPDQSIENPKLIPSYARYEGPYNIASTSMYEWIVTLTWQFTDIEAAAEFYRSVVTWENMER
jgi:hypothetical protein